MWWGLVFGTQLRVSVAVRRGLTLDTRFVPASRQPPNLDPCLYLLVRGSWRVHGGPSFEGPTAFVVSEEQLEGAAGERPLTYRTDPADFAMIEVHLRAADSSLRASASPVERALAAPVWSAAERVVDLAGHDDRSFESALRALLAALAADGVVSAETVERATQPPSAPLRLLWSALRPMAERLDLLATVQQVSDAMGARPREADRLLRAFLAAFDLVGPAWRPASLHLRLKLAVVFLSAEAASVTEVARVVGYGSTVAMARAFQEAGLPSPRAVHEALRAAEE